MRRNVYLQVGHVLIVDGVPMSGFAEGDYIEIKVDGNAASRVKGGDGPAMNISTPQGGSVAVSLQPTSPALGMMYSLRNMQAINPGLFSIQLMTGTEELIYAAGCAFGDLPQFATGGEKAAPRKFPFECLQVSLDTSLVESILGTIASSLI